jgi:hypothetical protein
MGHCNHGNLRRLFDGAAASFRWTLRVKLRDWRHQSPSRARIIAGLFGFFTLTQSRDGPDL